MARLRNTLTGAVVNVDDDTAARLGQEWESAEGDAKDTEAAPKKSTQRKASTTKTDK